MHVMWYESEMVNETLDSLKNALQYANGEVNIEICLNSQYYLLLENQDWLEDSKEVIEKELYEWCNGEIFNKEN